VTAHKPAQTQVLSLLGLSLLSILVGGVAGLGAVLFRGLIALFHNLFFLGRLSLTYDANAHTPASPWGPLVILVPVLGSVGVAFLIKNLALEAKGPGVSQVIDAIHYHQGVVRPIVAVIKPLASSLSLGSGGSAGREGPIIQVGASFGSAVGQILPLPAWQRITLVAAGAGGGIGATFNAPIGGALFAMEIILPELSVRTLVPVVLSAVTATYVGEAFLGSHPAFVIPQLEALSFQSANPLTLGAYVVLGAILGIVAALYIKAVYGVEGLFYRRIERNYYVRHAAGMLPVGVLTYVLFITYGEYYIEGVGYATVQDVLSGTSFPVYLLLLLFALKLIATALTLGSGGSGGVFSPGLFMGATLGAAYGIVLHKLLPQVAAGPAAFAVAGMAGLVGGATGATFTTIVMIFEMTLDYNVILPMTLVVALSYGIRRALMKESIYTAQLVRRGHEIPQTLTVDYRELRRAGDVMDPHILDVPGSLTVREFMQNHPQATAATFLVRDGSRIAGLVSRETIAREAARVSGAITMEQIASQGYVIVSEDTQVDRVITAMRSHHASAALVFAQGRAGSPDRIVGLITEDQIMDVAVDESGLN
jgi:CIC family chloride channel protein